MDRGDGATDSKHYYLCVLTVLPFWGLAGTASAKELLTGNVSLGLRGCLFWSQLIEDCIERVNLLEKIYSIRLDEKRNFWTFVLALATFATWPVTALMSYWAMNFDDILEFSADFWPTVPGVYIFWLSFGLLYTLMLLLALHYRVIYMAT